MENKAVLDACRTRIFESLGVITQCLASPARLRIVQILSNRPCTVELISQISRESVANTSQHLQKLLKAGLVRCEKQGVSRIYRLSNENVIEAWLSLQKLAGDLNRQIQEDEMALCPPNLVADLESEKMIKWVRSGKAILLDVREAPEYGSTPVPHSIHIPSAEIEKRFKELPKSKTIFIFCRGRYCALANPSVEFLRKKGYKAFRVRETSYQLNKIAAAI